MRGKRVKEQGCWKWKEDKDKVKTLTREEGQKKEEEGGAKRWEDIRGVRGKEGRGGR